MLRPIHRLAHTLVALGLAATALPGWSAGSTVTANLSVTATVISACTVSGATLNFGNSINPLSVSVPIDTTANLTVTCTSTTPYTVALSAGLNSSGVFTARAVKNGSNTLGYQLYTDTGRSTVWGDGTSSTSTVAGTGTGSNQTVPVYGRMPAISGAVPGTYTDTVTVTVSY